jgi:hypothetical protein
LRLRALTALVLWVGLQVIGAAEQLKGFTSPFALAQLRGAVVGVLFGLIFGNS